METLLKETRINKIQALLVLSITFFVTILGLTIAYDFTNEPGVLSESTSALKTNISISSIVPNGNDSYNISYVYTIENQSEYLVYDIDALNELANNLSPYSYDIVSFSSSDFTTNNLFNGSSVTSLLSAGNELTSGEKGSLYLTIRLYNEGHDGPFENSFSATGLIQYPNNTTTTSSSTDTSTSTSTSTGDDTTTSGSGSGTDVSGTTSGDSTSDSTSSTTGSSDADSTGDSGGSTGGSDPNTSDSAIILFTLSAGATDGNDSSLPNTGINVNEAIVIIFAIVFVVISINIVANKNYKNS